MLNSNIFAQLNVLSFSIAVFSSILVTWIVSKVARRYGILDVPKVSRKIHTNPTPLMGGVGLYASLLVTISLVSFISHKLAIGNFDVGNLFGFLIAGFVLVVGGVLDDKYDLSPRYQIIFPLVATLVTILSGTVATSISNPLGGSLYFGGLVGSLISFAWIMGMMYTTKYLDGVDGLVSGLVVIASVIMFFVSLDITLKQEYVALFALIITGVFCGFLFFNFNPASIFLGEGGSLLAGYCIAVLAILSGTKIATALLVFGIPILDVLWVIVRRLRSGVNIFKGDKLHLHHRLLNIGLTPRQVTLSLYLVCALFGSSSVVLQTRYKLYVLMLLAVCMVVLAFVLILRYNTGDDKENNHT